MGIGGRETHRQRDAVAAHREVVLRTQLAAVGRVAAGLLAPLLARRLRESAIARDPSTAASSPSRFSSRVRTSSQTPAACRSRSRRRQVAPRPQPGSFSSRRHGQPVRGTKTMPAEASRTGPRGRPSFGFGGSSGSSRAMASGRASGTSGSPTTRKRGATLLGLATRSNPTTGGAGAEMPMAGLPPTGEGRSASSPGAPPWSPPDRVVPTGEQGAERRRLVGSGTAPARRLTRRPAPA